MVVYVSGFESFAAKRKAHSKYIQSMKERAWDVSLVSEGYADIVIDFELFMSFEQKDSQLAEALMNYYKIVFKRVNTFKLVHFSNRFFRIKPSCWARSCKIKSAMR